MQHLLPPLWRIDGRPVPHAAATFTADRSIVAVERVRPCGDPALADRHDLRPRLDQAFAPRVHHVRRIRSSQRLVSLRQRHPVASQRVQVPRRRERERDVQKPTPELRRAAHDLYVAEAENDSAKAADVMVLLESLYMQVPVVAPAVGGIPEILCAKHGALVEKQTPEAYADAIENCMDRHSSLSKSMERAPNFIERHYSAVQQAKAYKEVYQQVLTQK